MSDLVALFQKTFLAALEQLFPTLAHVARVELLSAEAWRARDLDERRGQPGSFPERVRQTITTHGTKIEIPGDPGAPEMRARVEAAAREHACLPARLFFDLLNLSRESVLNRALLPAAPLWTDGRPLFAEGRLGSPQGNLFGGSGWQKGDDLARDAARVLERLGEAIFLAPNAPGSVDAWRRFAHEHLREKRSLVWIAPDLEPARQDWFAFAAPPKQGDSGRRAVTFYQQAPTAFEQPAVVGYEGAEKFERLPTFHVASRIAVEIVAPQLCVKVEKRS